MYAIQFGKKNASMRKLNEINFSWNLNTNYMVLHVSDFLSKGYCTLVNSLQFSINYIESLTKQTLYSHDHHYFLEMGNSRNA